jgi:hypothetical protein
MTMPGDIRAGSGTSYFGGNLTAYVQNGTIAEARLDDMGLFPSPYCALLNIDMLFSHPYPRWLLLPLPGLAVLPSSKL